MKPRIVLSIFLLLFLACCADTSSATDNADDVTAVDVPENNGIGTSPTDPQYEGAADKASASSFIDEAQTTNLEAVCTKWETLPCGYIFGRLFYCRMCVCEELPGCHGSPLCASCSGDF